MNNFIKVSPYLKSKGTVNKKKNQTSINDLVTLTTPKNTPIDNNTATPG